MNCKWGNGRWKTGIREMRFLFERRFSRKPERRKPAKDQIMQRFERWLDEVLAEEKPLEGIDLELLSELEAGNSSVNKDDLYSTWSAMTALTQEVKLQGRAFRALSDELNALSGLGASVEKLAETHRDAVADARDMAERAHAVLTGHKNDLKIEANARARHEVINVLIDIRERLIIGLRSTKESQRKLDAHENPNRLKKLFHGKNPGIEYASEIISSLRKGYGLGLDRLDETMRQFGVFAISCEDKPFDPNVMSAVDIEENTDVSDGTVLEVYRTGYATDTEIIQPAQVKVARTPEKESAAELKN